MIEVKIPDDPRALEWYERGKRHFYAKRGQLNLACADCHVNYAGMSLRTDLLSPALGHVTHFPVYRSKWGELGTLHRRYGGCNRQVRAKDFPAQSEEYRALEFFHTYMSNGFAVNGPGARK
jgi:sulfur-oxidizing protein SoxA